MSKPNTNKSGASKSKKRPARVLRERSADASKPRNETPPEEDDRPLPDWAFKGRAALEQMFASGKFGSVDASSVARERKWRRELVCYPDLKEVFGIPYSRVHLQRLIKADKFPRPLQLSPGRVAWELSAITTWVASRVASESTAAA